MARALTTPRTIVATGAVAAAAIAGGLPLLVAGGLAALAYGITSIFTVARPKELAKVIFPDIGIDLSRLDAVGLDQMQQALMARQSFRQALKQCPPGPFLDRFTDMGDRVNEVVEGMYKLVLRAQTLREYLSRNRGRDKSDELARAQAKLRQYPSGVAHDQIAAQVDALQEQLKAQNRIKEAYDGALAKIDATTARVDQLGAQLTEVVLVADDRAADAALPGARDDVARLVDELDAVRAALDEVTSLPALDMPIAPAAQPSRRREAQTE